MAVILTSITSVFEAAIGWAGTVATTVAENNLLLIFVIVPLVGLGVGLFSRLLHVRG